MPCCACVVFWEQLARWRSLSQACNKETVSKIYFLLFILMSSLSYSELNTIGCRFLLNSVAVVLKKGWWMIPLPTFVNVGHEQRTWTCFKFLLFSIIQISEFFWILNLLKWNTQSILNLFHWSVFSQVKNKAFFHLVDTYSKTIDMLTSIITYNACTFCE